MEGTALPESTVREDLCPGVTFDVDSESGAGYLAVHGQGDVDYTIEVGEGILLDFSREVGLVGVEILDPSWELLRFFGLAE